MLIISNGAFRSGSTWVSHIIRSIIENIPIPVEYQNTSAWKSGSSIHPKKLSKFLQDVDYHKWNFVSKNHFHKPYFRDLILLHDDVFVVDVQRDIRDAVTSAYYYYKRKVGFEGDFEKFYWKIGRLVADSVKRYHHVWDIDSSNIYIVSYERLKNDYLHEVEMLGNFLGIDLTEQDINRICQETNIDKLRSDWQEQDKPEEKRFFRKGKIGDWKNHFNEDMLNDIKLIQEQGLGLFERYLLKIYYLILLKRNLLNR